MVEYDPFDWATAHNPFPVYRQLRDEAPVYHNERLGFWALSRYDDVVAGHLNSDDFSSAHGVTIEGAEKDAPFLIVKDPPEHTAHRRIVGRLFTPRRIALMEPFIRRTAADLLDKVRGADRFDVVEDFSFRLPLDVISELIGIPESDRMQIHHLSDRWPGACSSSPAPDTRPWPSSSPTASWHSPGSPTRGGNWPATPR